ncbi:uncharacterized protein LOC102371857 [Alligator sinensis]|uniref:Uncharacterized protein LOC102371857 n=1 Tax=Alligator sinensis TaxID=38654 RepID=A0A1U7RIB7_ALLSI|nr:uncharacterized protein LOC102371857 [Alligator sinensis]
MDDLNELEACTECGERKYGDIIFHKLYCYDLYIPSAAPPQNKKQIDVDNFIDEKIVTVLEKNGFLCYHGYRNFTGGEMIIQAISKPMKIIPVTLIPIYKDHDFLKLQDMLITPAMLKRIVLLLFDATQTEPVLLQCCYSIDINDPQLLPKIIKTIEHHRTQIPVSRRKERALGEGDTESTSSSSLFIGRESPFERSARSRISFRPSGKCQGTSYQKSYLSWPQRYKAHSHREIKDILKDVTCLPFRDQVGCLLNYCEDAREGVRAHVCQALIRTMRKNILTFSGMADLEDFEQTVGMLLQNNRLGSHLEPCLQLEKLYCWTLALIFINVSMVYNVRLRAKLRALTFTKQNIPSKERNYEHLCRNAYKKINTAICTAAKKPKAWPNFMAMYVKHLKHFLRILEQRVSFTNERVLQFNCIQKQLQRIPWVVRHIFILVITEKVFEEKLLEIGHLFLFNVCTKMGKKHWEISLEIVERVTEHIQESHTPGSVTECLKCLISLWEWCVSADTKGKKCWMMTILNHCFQKLIYHPLSEVRNCIAPLLFSEGGTYVNITELGNNLIPASPKLMEPAVQEYLKVIFPDLIIRGQLQAHSSCMIAQGTVSTGNVLICMAKQQTLNDILQTNSTESGNERFQEVIRIVKLCQVSNSIASLKKFSSCSVPPFYMLEDGKPLLTFLQEERNGLTLSSMVGILKDIATAVWSCHQRRVLLCDITPASFVVFTEKGGEGGSLQIQTKLSNFFSVKMTPEEEDGDYRDDCPYETFKPWQLTGDSEEPLSVYFSAPESLTRHVFSTFSDTWMVAATFYSVLLYGAQTYFELSHLPVSKFIDEICKGHQAQRPDSIPLKLWEVIAANLLHLDIERMSMDVLLEHLENYKSSLGPDLNRLHEVKSGFSPICAEDIKRGCFDSKGSFKEWDAPNRFLSTCQDITEQKEGCLHELVSFKMNHMTRMTVCMLDHRNLLSVKEILNCFPATKLISRSLGDYTESLDQVACNMDHGKLLSCLEQVASAMMYLHSSKIIHCDLRCSYIYVNCGPSFSEVVAKVGRLGRAVCLPDTGSEGNLFVPYVRKVMPVDAAKWSAPEVRNGGLYSRASDVFTFGLVVWEALTTRFTNLHMYKLLKPFHLLNSKEVLKFTEEILKFTDEENISDKELEKVIPLILCMKACWNSNPTRRHPFSSILELVMEAKDAYRVSDDLYYNTTSVPSVANEDIYDSVYFRSETPKEDVYSCISDPDPADGHANDNFSVYDDVAGPEPLEGSSLYFSKKEKWGEVVSEFETGKGIERSPVSFYNPKQAGMYADTGINWKKKLKSGKSRML